MTPKPGKRKHLRDIKCGSVNLAAETAVLPMSATVESTRPVRGSGLVRRPGRNVDSHRFTCAQHCTLLSPNRLTVAITLPFADMIPIMIALTCPVALAPPLA